MTQLSESIRRLQRSIRRVARTHYPAFIFGFPTSRGPVPVFAYHDVEPHEFAADLSFLQENGYRTLGIEEFLQGSSNTQRSVLLTFDDARRNFWEVAFPLLRKFNARATLFVPTYWVAPDAEVDRQRSATSRNMFMSWDQVRECAMSDNVDVQSHGHRHALVYTSRRLVGFATPRSLASYDIYDWPIRRHSGQESLGYPPLGTPIYEATPLLSAPYRVLEDEDVVRTCQHAVLAGGGEEFFQRQDWVSRLTAMHAEVAAKTPQFSRMPEESFQSLVTSEFQESRQCFERQLGISPRFFAYPWMLGSIASLSLAKDFELVAAFGVGLDFRRIRRLRSPLPVFGRFKGEWLRFLPGHGRLRLHEVLPRKIAGFVRSQHLAH